MTMPADLQKVKERVKATVEGWVLKSIESTYAATSVPSGGTPLAAFMLLSNAIDMMAGFYRGRTDPKGRTITADYKAFVKEYLKTYDPVEVYVDIRCALTHNYSVSGSLALTHQNPAWHLKRKGKWKSCELR